MSELTKTGDIGVYFEGVSSVLSDVTSLYNQLETKIDNLNDKKEHIYDYWKSEEAVDFHGKMDTVSGYFTDFCTHYGYFIELLRKVMSFYEQEEESILQALQKYAGTKGSS